MGKLNTPKWENKTPLNYKILQKFGAFMHLLLWCNKWNRIFSIMQKYCKTPLIYKIYNNGRSYRK